jgi:hypothetical protein
MKKPLFSAIYFFTLATAGLTIHQAFAERAPAVEPLTEVSLEDSIPKKDNTGFDFHTHDVVSTKSEAKRVPANIATKTSGPATPYSYIGPMIFLLALPAALWIVVAKKMKNSDAPSKVDYYPKTHQFKPYKAENNGRDVDDEEDYPKAS